MIATTCGDVRSAAQEEGDDLHVRVVKGSLRKKPTGIAGLPTNGRSIQPICMPTNA
jgi:hypothetical protein